MSRIKQGKYFIIKTKINPDLVLEIATVGEVHEISVSSQIQDWVGNNDHQLWYYNNEQKTLTNKKYNLLLDVNGDKIIMRSQKSPGHEHFILDSSYIKAETLGLVMEFDGNHCTLKEKKDDNILQFWKIENQPALFFYIKHKSSPSLVVDVKGDDKVSGAKVILYESKGDLSDNQLWYEDQQGFLRSKLNEFAMDLTDKNEVILNPYKNGQKQQWLLSGNYIRNCQIPTTVLQMKPGNVFVNHRLVAVQGNRDENLCQWEMEFIEHQSISLNHSGRGKSMAIRSMLTGQTLEIADKVIDVGNKVVFGRYDDDPSKLVRQHFYQDKVAGVIRSVLRNFVLEATDEGLKLSPYDPYNKMQMWQVDVNKMRNRHDTSLVLQANKEINRVMVAQDSNNNDQLWEFHFMPATCFLIASVLSGKVLDVRGNNASSGASVILYSRNDPVSDNQLWYEDEGGLLRSKLNGYVLDSSNEEVQVMPFDPKNREQQWMIVGDRIQNRFENKMVIDISGENKRSGASLIKYKFHGGDNQRWKFDYVK